jgi:hypothetical protein
MKIFFVLAFVVALSACSKPTDTVVPTSLDKIGSIKPQIEKLTPGQQKLFGQYVLRHTIGSAMGGAFGIKAEPIPEGITIGKAIDQEQEYLKKEEEYLKKLQAQTDELLKKTRALREDWQFESTTDKFTDEKKAFASINNKEDGKDGFIIVGCYPTGIETKVSAGKYIGGSETYHNNVKYRVDNNKFAVSKMNPTSKDYVYEDDKNSVFLKALVSGKEIIVELTSYDGSTSTASFSLNGAAPAINKVLDLCKDRK